jgi:hypothetical protein
MHLKKIRAAIKAALLLPPLTQENHYPLFPHHAIRP